jgi:hypothetical protein
VTGGPLPADLSQNARAVNTALRCLGAATYFQGISMGWRASKAVPEARSCLRR